MHYLYRLGPSGAIWHSVSRRDFGQRDKNQARVKLAWRTNQQLLKVLSRGAGHSAGILARARQAKDKEH
jgi:hypothetical protein